jgi:hypothetical protein
VRWQVSSIEACQRVPCMMEEKTLIEQHDSEMIRCPRIGGYVTFKLCRSENNMLPCRFVVGCWRTQMDINAYLVEHFSKEELNKVFVPPKPKLESLVITMEKAKQRTGCNS